MPDNVQVRPASATAAIVIGAGPAGLIAAETLAAAGLRVALHDHMPSVGRKLLMAGRGGLNLTHSEALSALLARYRPQAAPLLEAIHHFPPTALIAWCEGLGIPTFVGSSGRVFPIGLKASPLLRAWLRRLGNLGVTIRTRSRWLGWSESGGMLFSDSRGDDVPTVTILALGGASWPRLGSDGQWPSLLPKAAVRPWAPSNMGVVVPWSDHFALRHEGTPLKRIAINFGALSARGEAIVTRTGLEGGAIYALSAPLRDALSEVGSATITLDLRPDLSTAEVMQRLASRPRADSMSTALRKAVSLTPTAIGLVQEALRGAGAGRAPGALVKALPLRVTAVAPIARAISSAGGLSWSALDKHFMITSSPGVFACGEMLNWEAPTGGYLLQGCFSTGVAAAHGALAWLGR
jgi:uncharacterized flavoprotein (TIGR03862 family)